MNDDMSFEGGGSPLALYRGGVTPCLVPRPEVFLYGLNEGRSAFY